MSSSLNEKLKKALKSATDVFIDSEAQYDELKEIESELSTEEKSETV